MISVEQTQTLYLGRVGEQNVEPLPFDIAPWIAKYGQGVAVLTVKRACDSVPYPVDIATEGNVVTWTVSKKDVESYGTGKAELTYMVDDKIKKSVVYKTYTEKSLADITPTPEDGQTWLDAMTKQVLKAEGHSTQSESYAHGGTGVRVDEDTDNAKFYSEQASLDAQTTDADRQVVEQAKTEVLESAKEVGLNKQAVENVAKDVADAEVRIGKAEDDIRLIQTDVKSNKDAVDLAKTEITGIQTDITKKAKQVATDKDTVVNVVNGFDQKVADANNTIDKAKTDSVSAVVAEGAKQVNLVKQEGATQKKVVDDAVNGIVADREQINQNKNDILSLQNRGIYSNNLFRGNNITYGKYVNWTNGGLSSNNLFSASDFIEILPSTVYGMFNIKYIAWYDSLKRYISGVKDNKEYETSPENAKYIRFSFLQEQGIDTIFFAPKDKYDSQQVKIKGIGIDIVQELGQNTNTVMSQKAVTDAIKNALPTEEQTKKYYKKTGSMNSGDIFETTKMSIKKNNNYYFTAHITDFSEIQIGNGTTGNESSYISIDRTNVVVHNYFNVSAEKSYAHGLNFSDFIGVKISVRDKSVAKITIFADKVYEFEHTWYGCHDATHYVKCINATLTNCNFIWACDDFKAPIYAFGDSYFLLFGDKTWTSNLINDGYGDNVLMCGYAGSSSSHAITALTNVLAFQKPKYVLWCMGMNDGSDSIDSPQSSWLYQLNRAISICEENGIEIILSTIPTVKTVNNEQKTMYVRNSGKRFIDFYKAVGANKNGDWYVGMQADDHVHATESGGKALYLRAIYDFPELIK